MRNIRSGEVFTCQFSSHFKTLTSEIRPLPPSLFIWGSFEADRSCSTASPPNPTGNQLHRLQLDHPRLHWSTVDHSIAWPIALGMSYPAWMCLFTYWFRGREDDLTKQRWVTRILYLIFLRYRRDLPESFCSARCNSQWGLTISRWRSSSSRRATARRRYWRVWLTCSRGRMSWSSMEATLSCDLPPIAWRWEERRISSIFLPEEKQDDAIVC